MDRLYSALGEKSYRWVIVAANFMVMIALWTPWATYGVFLPRMAQEMGWHLSYVHLVGSILLIMGAAGLFIGKIIDEYGPQKLMVLEVIFCSAAFLLGSTTRSLWQLYLYLGIMEGCAFAGAYIIPSTTTARWFDRQRGLAMGIVMSAIGVAYTIGPTLMARLMTAYGWRTAFLIFGAAAGLLGLLPALLLRNPDASSGQAPPVSPGTPDIQNSTAAAAVTLKSAATTATFWILVFVWSSQAFGQMMFVFHFVPLQADKGIGLAAAASALSLYGPGLIIGRLIPGPLSDRVGAVAVLLGSTALAAVSLGLVVAASSLTLLYAGTFGFGIALSGADNTYARALPDIVGTRPLGILMGALAIGWRLGGAMGPPFAGFLFETARVYALPFGIGIAVLLAGGGLFLMVSGPQWHLERRLAQQAASRSGAIGDEPR